MNKRTKWCLTGAIIIGLAGWGIWSQLPKENEELQLADKVQNTRSGRKALNVTAEVIKPRSLQKGILSMGGSASIYSGKNRCCVQDSGREGGCPNNFEW